MGKSNSGVDAFLLGVGVDPFNPGWSWSGVALTRSGVQVELELALFFNSD